MTELVAVDIGGTHARFALFRIECGKPVQAGDAVTLATSAHRDLASAWAAFGSTAKKPLPPRAAIAIAAPIAGDEIRLTNNSWVLRPASLGAELGVTDHILVNDFEAVGHAVTQLDGSAFGHLCGPDGGLPEKGVISIIGPGTGLGVACIVRNGAEARVLPTEGGHIGFSPLDECEDALHAHLRALHGRVSVERVAAGPGLAAIYTILSARVGKSPTADDDRTVWDRALAGQDSIASAALERFCCCLGSIAGDIALAQGASAVVIAGGLGQRLADILPHSGFAARFTAKGRFAALMQGLPVKIITLAEPGLFGAAAAYARRSCR